jgi:predicted transcriptional regulator
MRRISTMSYSPKIKPELVRKLYQLKHSDESSRVPMTRMVNQAVEEYLERRENSEPDENSKSSGENNGIGNRYN